MTKAAAVPGMMFRQREDQGLEAVGEQWSGSAAVEWQDRTPPLPAAIDINEAVVLRQPRYRVGFIMVMLPSPLKMRASGKVADIGGGCPLSR
ncbi:MAG: hypothetical protein R3F10_04425 [Lysobacteraceae bacterium]